MSAARSAVVRPRGQLRAERREQKTSDELGDVRAWEWHHEEPRSVASGERALRSAAASAAPPSVLARLARPRQLDRPVDHGAIPAGERLDALAVELADGRLGAVHARVALGKAQIHGRVAHVADQSQRLVGRIEPHTLGSLANYRRAMPPPRSLRLLTARRLDAMHHHADRSCARRASARRHESGGWSRGHTRASRARGATRAGQQTCPRCAIPMDADAPTLARVVLRLMRIGMRRRPRAHGSGEAGVARTSLVCASPPRAGRDVLEPSARCPKRRCAPRRPRQSWSTAALLSAWTTRRRRRRRRARKGGKWLRPFTPAKCVFPPALGPDTWHRVGGLLRPR